MAEWVGEAGRLEKTAECVSNLPMEIITWTVQEQGNCLHGFTLSRLQNGLSLNVCIWIASGLVKWLVQINLNIYKILCSTVQYVCKQ